MDKRISLATAILGLLAAFITFAVKYNYLFVSLFQGFSGKIAIVLAAILILVGLFAFWKSRNARGSRLADPDALRLNPESLDKLVGRDDDLTKLRNALTQPLVFLVGESGCGKSALLRIGIEKNPQFNSHFLPLYIDMSVQDWEGSLVRALRDTFIRALPTDSSFRQVLDTDPSPSEFRAAFHGYFLKYTRRPLLLLDQFDDFQARYRERFLPNDTNVWRRAHEIAEENGFWRVLQMCLAPDVLSILIACRDDAQASLESVSFLPSPPRFELARLERVYVWRIIDQLIDRPVGTPAVIVDPEKGWTQLRERLVDELEARGPVLPQQLKVVLGGLRALRRLTLAEYVRHGRLAGLEADFVAEAISRAARASKIQDIDVLNLLVGLVDAIREPPDASAPRAAAALAASGKVPYAVAASALAKLQEEEIVRPSGAVPGAPSGWQLYHAYLALPITRLQRDRDESRRLLADGARAYSEAGGSLRRRWQALLPLIIQSQLLRARLRGRFRYAEYRSFALKSTARALPVIVGIGVAAGYFLANKESERKDSIERRLADLDATLTPQTSVALADLAAGSWLVRRWVGDDIFAAAEQAAWFIRSPDRALRALTLLDAARLDDLVRTKLTTDALGNTDPILRRATIDLLQRASPAALVPDTIRRLIRIGGDAVGNSEWPVEDYVDLVLAYGNFAAKGLRQDSSQTGEVLAELREAIGKATSPDRLGALAQVYEEVAKTIKRDDPQARVQLDQVCQAIIETSDPDRLWALERAYWAVAMKIKPQEAQSHVVVVKLIRAIRETTDPYQLWALALAYSAALKAIEESLPQMGEVVAKLCQAIGEAESPDQISALTLAYRTVVTAVKKGDLQATELLARLRRMIEETANPLQLSALAQAYGETVAATNSEDPETDQVLAKLRDAMTTTADPGQLGTLAQAYGAAAAAMKAGSRQTEEELENLLQTIVASANPSQLWALAWAYGAAAATIKRDDLRAVDVLAKLRAAMGEITDPNQLGAIGEAYEKVAPLIKQDDLATKTELARLRRGIEQVASPWGLSGLARACRAVTPIKEDASLTNACPELGETASPYQLWALAAAYRAVARNTRQGDEQAGATLTKLEGAAATKSANPFQIWALSQAYGAVASPITEPVPEAPALLAKLRDVIGKTSDPQELQALAEAYRVVVAAVKEDSPEARAELAKGIAVLLSKMGAVTTEVQSLAFAQAIMVAASSGASPLSRDETALVVAAVLLQPLSAGKPSVYLVNEYQKKFLRGGGTAPQPSASDHGDVWDFVAKAANEVPGFDPHQPKLGFLPPPQ